MRLVDVSKTQKPTLPIFPMCVPQLAANFSDYWLTCRPVLHAADNHSRLTRSHLSPQDLYSFSPHGPDVDMQSHTPMSNAHDMGGVSL